ncbi:hypothetical protein QP166_14430 [Sphingomonas sp. LR60]|uniref:hypothetical protein n=1 Tax=Sphingomonas sp. LR60 TaxID=3050233 RepID=UPI002FE31357
MIAAPSRDRTATNLSVLAVAAACGASPDDASLHIRDVGISEVHFPFSPPTGITFKDTVISILHASGVDLTAVTFDNGVNIATLEMDRQTLLPSSFPQPQLIETGDRTIADQREIKQMLNPDVAAEQSNELEWSNGMTELLGRVERYRPFWLRTNIEDTDPQGRRIISHGDWPALYEALKQLDLVTIRSRQAAGVRADFVHFKQDVKLSVYEELHALFNDDCAERASPTNQALTAVARTQAGIDRVQSRPFTRFVEDKL